METTTMSEILYKHSCNRSLSHQTNLVTPLKKKIIYKAEEQGCLLFSLEKVCYRVKGLRFYMSNMVASNSNTIGTHSPRLFVNYCSDVSHTATVLRELPSFPHQASNSNQH